MASIGLGLEFAEPLKASLLKQTADPDILNFIHGLDQTKGVGISVAIVGLIPLSFFFILAIARANKFALAFVIIENGVNVALLLMSTKNESRIGAILPILFLIYALLRICGAAGPKIR